MKLVLDELNDVVNKMSGLLHEDYSEKNDEFSCTLTLFGENAIGAGKSKKTAKAAAAILLLNKINQIQHHDNSFFDDSYKNSEPIRILSYLTEMNREPSPLYQLMKLPNGEGFQSTLIIRTTGDKYISTGVTKREAKNNSALNYLKKIKVLASSKAGY